MTDSTPRIEFKVYQIERHGRGSDENDRYGLELIRSFDTYHQAVTWIHENGKKKDYTIIEVFRGNN